MSLAAHTAPWVPKDTFGLRLVALRTELRMTQVQIADLCGLDDGSWSNWERGSSPRSLERVAQQISDATGCDYAWLMMGTAGGKTLSRKSVRPSLRAIDGGRRGPPRQRPLPFLTPVE